MELSGHGRGFDRVKGEMRSEEGLFKSLAMSADADDPIPNQSLSAEITITCILPFGW